MKRLVKRLLLAVLSVLPEPGSDEHRGAGKLHLHWRRGWIKAQFMRAVWFLRRCFGGSRVMVGKRLSIQGSLRVRGPGTLIIGDDVIIGSRTDLYTQAIDAVIRVGNRAFLNGSRVSCVREISFGPDVIIADARLLDTDFHSLSKNRHRPDAPVATGPIHIEENVWLAIGVVVLKGVRVGRDSVVGAGSVVLKDLPAGRLYGGNPARDLGPVPE